MGSVFGRHSSFDFGSWGIVVFDCLRSCWVESGEWMDFWDDDLGLEELLEAFICRIGLSDE